eukprot:5454510-Pleurochrysis_carterae.AAC.4
MGVSRQAGRHAHVDLDVASGQRRRRERVVHGDGEPVEWEVAAFVRADGSAVDPHLRESRAWVSE